MKTINFTFNATMNVKVALTEEQERAIREEMENATTLEEKVAVYHRHVEPLDDEALGMLETALAELNDLHPEISIDFVDREETAPTDENGTELY